MLCYAILYCTMLYYAMLYYAMLYYVMLCYAMLCYAILCYALLCYATLMNKYYIYAVDLVSQSRADLTSFNTYEITQIHFYNKN